MKVLQVHNYYQTPGGEDSVVEVEGALLRLKRVKTNLFSVHNDNVTGALGKIKLSLTAHYSHESLRAVRTVLSDGQFDIMHAHNTFPLLSPSIYDAGVPVVQTLHNYRTVCPTALLMHKGKSCERSFHESAYWAVPYKVYRDSYAGTLVLAHMIDYHQRKGTWKNKVDRFICLTEFSKKKFIQAGFPAHKISIKPNFTEDPGFDKNTVRSHNAIFVGRLSEEKGIQVLLKSWGDIDYPLNIIGEGDCFGKEVNVDINFCGRKPKNDVLNAIKTAQFIIVPSICYEGFPMAIVEAFACGTPVLCSRLGSMEEIVEDGVTGLHFEAGNARDLAEKAQWLIDNPKRAREMGQNARDEYLAKYTPEKNYEILMDIYQQAIDEAKKIQ